MFRRIERRDADVRRRQTGRQAIVRNGAGEHDSGHIAPGTFGGVTFGTVANQHGAEP